jgi:hypothetical protein
MRLVGIRSNQVRQRTASGPSLSVVANLFGLRCLKQTQQGSGMIGHLVVWAAGGCFLAITGSLQADRPGLIEGPVPLELLRIVHRTKDEVVGGLLAVFKILFRDSKPSPIDGVELANGEP